MGKVQKIAGVEYFKMLKSCRTRTVARAGEEYPAGLFAVESRVCRAVKSIGQRPTDRNRVGRGIGSTAGHESAFA